VGVGVGGTYTVRPIVMNNFI